MSDFLKINRKDQILEIVLDRPKANALDAPRAGKWTGSAAEGTQVYEI